jgi:hypothetical protein
LVEKNYRRICPKNSLWFRLVGASEFLEARIVPQRIEHRIEPEPCGSTRQKLYEKFHSIVSARWLNAILKKGLRECGRQRDRNARAQGDFEEP